MKPNLTVIAGRPVTRREHFTPAPDDLIDRAMKVVRMVAGISLCLLACWLMISALLSLETGPIAANDSAYRYEAR